MRRLYRSRRNAMIGGVAGGLGEYLQIDPTIVRLGLVIGTIVTCFGVALFYLVAMIIVPLDPGEDRP